MFIAQFAWWLLKLDITYRCVGAVFAFCRAVFVYRIAPYFYKPPLDQYKKRWAVITGGTDGIGKAYTLELAKQGLKKFVLIGRNPSKVDAVKKTLEETYGAEVQSYIFDFESGEYEDLRKFIYSIDNIGFVLNSVGTGREKMEKYGENPIADSRIFRINGFGSADFLSMVLEPMNRNGGGQIVCISSCLGLKPIKFLAAYSSTKALLTCLSYCIDREYPNINVQILTPAVVATAMTYYKDGIPGNRLTEKLFVVTSTELAEEAVRTIGLVKLTAGTFRHEIELLLQHFPWFIQKHILDYILAREDKRVQKLLKAEKSQKNSVISENGRVK